MVFLKGDKQIFYFKLDKKRIGEAHKLSFPISFVQCIIVVVVVVVVKGDKLISISAKKVKGLKATP